MKTLDSISWNVPEPEYRQDKALSYSNLSHYESGGRFDSMSSYGERIESPSLTFGSAVDAIITEGEDAFNERFMVVDNDLDQEVASIVKAIYNEYSEFYKRFSQIPIDCVSLIAKQNGFWPADKWSDQARYNGLIKRGNIEEFWQILKQSENKTVISLSTYGKVCACVNALQNSDATRYFFGINDDDIERHYQLKFKATLNGIDYRCMFDCLIVDHKNKTIRPVDLKTSHKKEWNFAKSFIDFNYSIQARLYSRILRDNILRDEYFKNFTILPYFFIVVNNDTMDPVPLVWEYPDNFIEGELVYGKNRNIICRDPETIGKELYTYLNEVHIVPIDININDSNNLLDKLMTL